MAGGFGDGTAAAAAAFINAANSAAIKSSSKHPQELMPMLLLSNNFWVPSVACNTSPVVVFGCSVGSCNGY